MPSTKQPAIAAVPRSAYSGVRGKQLLMLAIEFLFFMKADEFKKFHPTFLVPSPDEFFDYAKQSYTMYPRTSHKRRAALELPTIKKSKNILFVQFLAFVMPGVTNTLLRNYAIVVYALTSFLVFKHAVDGSGGECDLAQMDDSISWFVNFATPSVCKTTLERLSYYVHHVLGPRVPSIKYDKAAPPHVCSREIVDEIGTILKNQIYFNVYFVIPLSYTFAQNDFKHMRELCMTTIEKHKDRFV